MRRAAFPFSVSVKAARLILIEKVFFRSLLSINGLKNLRKMLHQV